MFSIRQALRFAGRAVYNQYSAYHRYAVVCKPNGSTALCHNRLLHDSSSESKELGKLEGKMRLIFTCKKCSTRNSKLISKLAYDKGVIIVRCDGCKNNHLIADNLGWFTEIHKGINIEKIMATKGESVRRVMNDVDGYYEAVTNEEYKFPQQNVNETKELDNDNKCCEKIEKQ
ncbi:hypothetical protein DMN91_009362 [Ooceraea biroi]|uniref:DNL-type zinc finger protein n=1 Tax=Ooceraea biroi TaxID=2015173 RepID=A0A026X1Q0_OOCBI|nr:DNL-type zinc finger protein [Ooceraea biroi]EZA61936.1 DNL-type zinc finger protein [Ooceraea biroi]RLU19004.1 hypothetical protein DMN91_009362 [Ooceraea biroi]